jgi:hypothetical protein
MKTETLLLILVAGFAGYFIWKSLGAPTVSANPLSNVLSPPSGSPGAGKVWDWNGFQWVASAPGVTNL